MARFLIEGCLTCVVMILSGVFGAYTGIYNQLTAIVIALIPELRPFESWVLCAFFALPAIVFGVFLAWKD